MGHPLSIPKQWFSLAVCILLSLAVPLLSRAESSLTFTPIEESKYLLRGDGFESIKAVTVTVDYDTTYLYAPDVVVMGGRLLENDRGAASPPGNLLLQILNEDHNAVFEATIFFQKRGDYPPVINFVTAEVTGLSGEVRPLPVEMAAPVNSPLSEESSAETPPAPDPAASSPDGGVESLIRDGGGTADGMPAAPVEAKAETVAERFRKFSGEKSLAAFTALFPGMDPRFRQVPPVLIADGMRTARIVVSGVDERKGSPLFTVSGGRLISVERGKKDEWVVVVQPFDKSWDVWVSCTTVGETVVFPLTVAPAIEIPRRKLAKINEKNFMSSLRNFLAGNLARGKSNQPVWLLEYVFTANYLTAPGKGKIKVK